MDKARRYNKGKNRYELISPIALEELAKVYTLGAHKYSDYKDKQGNIVKGIDIDYNKVGEYELIFDASSNWKKGMSWKETIGSVKRHIASWEQGEDIDELGTKHLGNALWGLATLLDFYKTYPQGDDRPHAYLNRPKIGLDIDEILCNWVDGWVEKFDLHKPTSWFFDYKITERFAELKAKNELDDFYLGLKPLISPEDIPFEPHCYVTSRPVDTEVTIKWLEKHKFPTRPVITVPVGTSKVEVIKNAGVEIFVDDRMENFVELNNAGICTFLYDTPHNQRYHVGYKRLYNLKELI